MANNDPELLWKLKKKDTGKVYGKISFAKLKAWILEARIEPFDYVTNPQLKQWVEAVSIQELAPFFTPDSMGSEVISTQDIGFAWKTKDDEELTLELTPMIDVTFLLLIFFMVTATFAIHEVKNVTVPKGKHTEQYKQEKLSIAVDKNRRIYLGKEEVSLDLLKERVKEAVARTNQQDVVLAADRRLNYGFIMKVLDEINGAGLKSVKLKVEKQR